MTTAEFKVDDAVTWHHESRGGYGYVVNVDGVVVALTPKRVRIRVRKANGDEVIRTVRPEHLSPRKAVQA